MWDFVAKLEDEPHHTEVYDCELASGKTVCFGRPSAALDDKHTLIKARYGPCDRSEQRGATLVGVAFRYSYVCRSCICNAHTALVLRHGVPQPPVTTTFLPFDESVIDKVCEAYSDLHEVYESWKLKWPQAKRKAIDESELKDKFTPAALKPFVKREGNHALPKRPRLIQGYGTLRTQARYGPEFSTMQKALCHVFDLEGYEIYPGVRLTFGSGLNGDQLAAWMEMVIASLDVAVFYERDGTNWDATMQRVHHDLKQRFNYRACPELAEFVDQCFLCEGKFSSESGTLVYRLNGTVKSGHNDTTSGNSLVNGILAASSMHRLGLRGYVMVAGDDLIAAVEGDFDVTALAAEESKLGIVPKAAKFYSPLDVSFISACWLPDASGGYMFVPLLGRLLSRLWWTTSPPSKKRLDDYKYSVVQGLWPAVGDVPIYREFLEASRPARGSLISIDKHLRLYDADQRSGDATTEALCLKYGLSISELDHVRSVVSIRGAATLIRDPIVERIILRDTCGVGERGVTAGCPFTN